MLRTPLLTLVGALLVLAATEAPAAHASGPVVVTPDVVNLEVGAAPALPYLDVPNARIVDGSRIVSVAGLKATVVRLVKVDGGYVLGRTFQGGNDLVYVSTAGARTVLTSGWVNPGEGSLDPGVMVSKAGNRIVFNTAVLRNGWFEYRSTITMSVPGLAVLHRRTFSEQPTLLGFDGPRVLTSIGRQRVVWWTPGATAVTTVADKVAAGAADLSAGDYAVRVPTHYRVQGIPPATSPDWEVAGEDWELGNWSPDDESLAATGEVLRGTPDVEIYHVVQASDGVELLTVRVLGYPQITWEDDAHVLIRTGDSGSTVHQLIRCSLTGDCERVGATSASPFGPYVLASRRNS